MLFFVGIATKVYGDAKAATRHDGTDDNKEVMVTNVISKKRRCRIPNLRVCLWFSQEYIEVSVAIAGRLMKLEENGFILAQEMEATQRL